MVDTVRTLAALQALFADNASGDISPQDLRDFLVSAYPDWTTWSPTVANFTVGTGGNAGVTARYAAFGQTVICTVVGVLGTSGMSVGGSVTITLPLTATSLPAGVTRLPVGDCIFGDAGVLAYDGMVEKTSTTEVRLQAKSTPSSFLTLGNISSTVPFTWAASDWFTASWVYEIPEP